MTSGVAPTGYAISTNYDGRGEVGHWNTILPGNDEGGHTFYQMTAEGPVAIMRVYSPGPGILEIDLHKPGAEKGADDEFYGWIYADPTGMYFGAALPNIPQILGNGVGYTLSELPVSPPPGSLAVITDSTVNGWGETVVGGGSHTVFACFLGTSWTVWGKG